VVKKHIISLDIYFISKSIEEMFNCVILLR